MISSLLHFSKTQEDLTMKIKRLEKSFAESSQSNQAVFQAFIRESNITLCTGELYFSITSIISNKKKVTKIVW